MANGKLLQMLLDKGFTPEMLRARPLSPKSFQERVGRQKGILPRKVVAGVGKGAGSSSELLEGRARRTGLMERRQQSQAQPGVARPPKRPGIPGGGPGARALVQRGVLRRRGEL